MVSFFYKKFNEFGFRAYRNATAQYANLPLGASDTPLFLDLLQSVIEQSLDWNFQEYAQYSILYAFNSAHEFQNLCIKDKYALINDRLK